MVESRLTNSSGALVPSDTTVRPITIWGIPSSNDRVTEPATNSSPPPNSSRIPATIWNALRAKGMNTGVTAAILHGCPWQVTLKPWVCNVHKRRLGLIRLGDQQQQPIFYPQCPNGTDIG